MTSAAPPPNQAFQPTSSSTAPAAPSTPNKRDLKSWWKGFKLPSKHQEHHGRAPSTFASQPPPPTPTQPLFSEDVDETIDTSAAPLSLVLLLQDAHPVGSSDPILPQVCASSDATAPNTLNSTRRLNRLSLSITTPVRQCAKLIRAAVKTSPTSCAKGSAADNRPHGIFGVPLRQSITYANVAISLVDENGKSYIYGYVPIVVAKCGVFLKEKATTVEGIFRLSGSEKRIKELKQIFDSPDRYGKGLVWDNYTVHDAANVLRRYLNDLPEPVVPLDLYEKFREPLRGATRQAVGDAEGPQFVENFDDQAAIVKYQKLITELPPLNRQLLLYILDLLAVFAAKSEENRMNSQNLAAIFQPGMLSHPQHAMAPEEYRLNQCVLIFLIENQDHFLIGMQGTATDEKTKQLIEKGTPPAASGPVTPNPKRKSGLGRSASNASAGADSVRRDGMLRRNRSTSSRHSHHEGSTTPNSPALAPTPNSGLGRSNTVPSKKSPALQTGRFRRDASPILGSSTREPMIPTTTEELVEAPDQSPAASSISPVPAAIGTSSLAPTAAGNAGRSQERLLDPNEATTPIKERVLPSIFQRSPTGEGEKRQPNKLKKKRIPGSLNPSAQSSAASLSGTHSAAVSPSFEAPNPMDLVADTIPEHDSLAIGQQYSAVDTPSEPTPRASQVPSSNTLHPEQTLKAKKSPPTSLHSSFNEGSDVDQTEESIVTTSADASEPDKEKKRRWRLSRQRGHEHHPSITSPRLAFGSNDNADVSVTSIGSGGYRPRKSFTGESSETGMYAAEAQTSHESRDKDGKDESKGPIGWIRNKYREAKESAERRNKSPPADRQSSLGGSSIMSGRGKSLDIRREPEERAQNPPVPPLPQQAAPTQTASAQPPVTQTAPSQPPPPQPTSAPAQQASSPPVTNPVAPPASQAASPPAPAQPAQPAKSQLAAASQPEIAPPTQPAPEAAR